MCQLWIYMYIYFPSSYIASTLRSARPIWCMSAHCCCRHWFQVSSILCVHKGLTVSSERIRAREQESEGGGKEALVTCTPPDCWRTTDTHGHGGCRKSMGGKGRCFSLRLLLSHRWWWWHQFNIHQPGWKNIFFSPFIFWLKIINITKKT